MTNGPTATGQHCPEGWTLHQTPGPRMKGVEGSANADYHYYSWVDQFNALGLGVISGFGDKELDPSVGRQIEYGQKRVLRTARLDLNDTALGISLIALGQAHRDGIKRGAPLQPLERRPFREHLFDRVLGHLPWAKDFA